MDFKNLNQASLKDNYTLPNMDHLLQKVANSRMMSMLDRFLGFNQIEVNMEDQFKIAFTTPWRMFAYNRIPFGLINDGANFLRDMNSSLTDLKDEIIIIYLDDLTIFSKKRENHLRDLEKVLKRCMEHGILVNPKKSILYVIEGKLLGHVVSQESIKIDQECVRSIQ